MFLAVAVMTLTSSSGRHHYDRRQLTTWRCQHARDDKRELLPGQPSERNVGLYGMIERTELAGGRLIIRTRAGGGVALRAVL